MVEHWAAHTAPEGRRVLRRAGPKTPRLRPVGKLKHTPPQFSALFSTHAAAASAVSKPVLVLVKPVPARWFK